MKEENTAPATKSEKTKKTYIGPAYDKGITLPDNSLVRPGEMTQEEIRDLVEKHPPASEWFS